MKKKINRRLAVALVMSFVMYLLFGLVTQLLLSQKDMVRESEIIVGQLARIVEQADLSGPEDGTVWNGALSFTVPDEDSEMLIADSSTEKVLGSTEEQFVGKTLGELGFLPADYQRSGSVFHVTISGQAYDSVFFEYDGLLYGRLKKQAAVYRTMKVPAALMPPVVFALLLVLGIGLGRYVNENITQPLNRLADAIRRFADGENDVAFVTGKTDFGEIQLIGSCMNRIQDRITNLQSQLNEYRQLMALETERADAAMAAKRVFLSRMSHDIRTPMNGIIGMTAIAEVHIDDAERVRDALAKIDFSSKQLLEMFNDVLDMSMIESGRLDLKEENFQLAELINRIIAELRPMAEAGQHQLIVDVKRLVHEHVVGEPQRVRTIFANMIDNAVKYTPQGGTIRVTIAEMPSEIRYTGKYSFVFEDNGIGMSQETMNLIFEPFERVADDQRAGAIRGMGLGLPIVKSIAELMNGSVQVESEPGAGSKFSVTVCLKLQKRAEGAATRMLKQEVRLEDFQKEQYSDKRVLVAEDHELSGEITAEVLGMAGIEVEQVRNGQQAILRMGEVPEGYFDLILMDIQMPVMDGYIATRMIRSMKREDVRKLPIIAMTALSSGEDRETARQAGMDGYITKPLELDRLKEILMKWM